MNKKRSQKPEDRDDAGVSFDTVRAIAGKLAGAVEGTSYGTPAFFVGKTLFARQHQDGESLVIRIEPEERALRVKADPTTYSVTELSLGPCPHSEHRARRTARAARRGLATRRGEG